MNDLQEPKYATLIDSIEHQGIGGKEIMIEKQGTLTYLLDRRFLDMTIGEMNFIQRRIDLISGDNENIKIYYGHVGLLGYFVAEDEIKQWN